MIIKHQLSMDFQNRTSQPRLNMVQCDQNTRAIEISLTSAGKPWTPENITTVVLRYRKCDGTGGNYDTLPDGKLAWSAEANKITVLMAPQVLTVPGLVEAQAAIVCGEQCIATFSFQITVEEDPSVGSVQSEHYINWAGWAKEELENLLEEAKASGDFAGACYTPVVDQEGNLSWQNDAGMENPPEINIADIVAEKINGDVLQGSMHGNINMNGYRITSLSMPESDQDAATLGVVKKAAPRNLLDNSDFRNAVNQRGNTSYSGSGYTVDRWKLGSTDSSVTVGNTSGISFPANGKSTVFYQCFPLGSLGGKTLTFAVGLNTGEIITGAAEFPGSPQSRQVCSGGDHLILGFDAQSGVDAVTIEQSADAVTGNTVLWAALYEGTYPPERLPEYCPKGYAAELAECLRYFERIQTKTNYGTFANGFFRTKTEAIFLVYYSRKRVNNPTVTTSGTFRARFSVSAEIISLTANQVNPHSCQLIATTNRESTADIAAALEANMSNGAYIDISADL